MARGGYTFKEMAEMSEGEIRFLDHYQKRIEEGRWQYLNSMLGVEWDLEQQSKPAATDIGDNRKIFIPLSVAINPKIVEHVKEEAKKYKNAFIGGGEFRPEKNVEIRSSGELSKEDFFKLIGARSQKK